MFDFSLNSAWATVADNVDFSLSDVIVAGESDGIEDGRYVRPKVYKSMLHEVTAKNAADLVKTLDIKPGYRMFAIVSGDFVFGDLLWTLVLSSMVKPKRMTIQTLSMSKRNVQTLRLIMDRCTELESLRLVLSDYFYSHERRPGQLVPLIYETLDYDGRLDVAFASVHTKIVTIETTDGLKIVIDGSANLRSSRNIEQFRLECDDGLYDWIDEVTDRIFAAYSTINKDRPYPKSLRYSGLWGAVSDSDGGNADD